MNLKEAITFVLREKGLTQLPIAGALLSPSRQSILAEAWQLFQENSEEEPHKKLQQQIKLEVDS